MSAVAGLGTLVRANLRRDRTRTIIWALAIFLGVWSSVEALYAAYPDQSALDARFALLDNPAAIMMTGPLFATDYTIGAMVANELLLYVLIPAAIMGILLMVRHSREEEETGRMELILSRPVGRHAPAAAAAIAVTVASIAIGLATFAALAAARLELLDSMVFGLAVSLTALVFAALAAVIAQIVDTSRAANGIALGALALAFIVRGVGDVLVSSGSWLSWFSPLAWAQQTRLFVDVRVWPLAISLAAVVLLTGTAMVLARGRDLGSGLRAARPGPEHATSGLLSPTGLAERLLRSSSTAWLLGTFLFAVGMGALADSIHDALADIPMVADVLQTTGDDMVASFAGLVLSMVLLVGAALAAWGVLRLRAEETAGRAELMLVAGASRIELLAGWCVSVVGSALTFTLAMGLGTGTGLWLGTGQGHWIGDSILAAIGHLPAILVLISLTMALVGLLPRIAGLVWAIVVWVGVVLTLGPLLQLPDWLARTSPFAHVPLPGASIDWSAQIILLAITVAMVAVGLAGIRRRDLQSA